MVLGAQNAVWGQGHPLGGLDSQELSARGGRMLAWAILLHALP